MNIYNKQNEMRREIYSKMLKKRQQKSSMRLYDGVVVREWMQNKGHHHVYESRTFSKRPTWSKLMLTPIKRALTESSNELILGHNLQTLTTRIVRKLLGTQSTSATSCGVTGMCVPRTQMKKRGTERSISCMLE